VSLTATRELAAAAGVDVLALLRANRDRAWIEEAGSLAFESLRPGDVLRHPGGGEIEIVRMGAALRMGGAVPVLSTTSSDYSAALQASINQQSSAVQAQLTAATGVNTNNATVAQGASSAVTLFQNGYNAASDADNANLVHAIAGGLCLVPGVGPILGAAVEGLWTVGNAIAAPLQDALASVGLGSPANQPPCKSQGTWTTASILAANAGALPSRPTGSFGELATGALAYAASMVGNCQKVPPADVVIDACVSIWNRTHQGPAIGFYVPALVVQPGSLSPTPGVLMLGAFAQVSGTSLSARAGLTGNIFYAFDAAVVAQLEAGSDLSKPPTPSQPYWLPFGTSPFDVEYLSPPPGLAVSAPRVVQLNIGPLIAQTKHIAFDTLHLTPAPAPAAMSTGGKVAVGVAVAGALGAAAWLGLGRPASLYALKAAVRRF